MKKSKFIICFMLILLILTACAKQKQGAVETAAASQTAVKSETSTFFAEDTVSYTTTSPATAEIETVATEPTFVFEPESTKNSSTAVCTVSEATTAEITVADMKTFCTVRIECKTINENSDKLKDGKEAFIPSNGIILDDVQVEINGGESAFEVLEKACSTNVCTDNCQYCQKSGVQLEYTYTPAFNNYYIEGIHQIYEKDCGAQSGWMYSVNGDFPDVGSSSYSVSPGDVIVFSYTCNMGEDIGNYY